MAKRKTQNDAQSAALVFRDRIKEFKRVLARDLVPHPGNWRRHPQSQQDALRGVLAEVGYAGALIVRELEDGRYGLIDGHLRAETTPDQDVPVLVLDVDEREAKYLMATFDPLGALAEANSEALDALLQDVTSGDKAVQEMLAGLCIEPAAPLDPSPQMGALEYRIIVTCRDETHHAQVLAKLQKEGLECKVLIS